jgi:hypothetical protein
MRSLLAALTIIGAVALLVVLIRRIETPTATCLRRVAEGYLEDLNRWDWESTYQREWFQLRPEIEVSLEEYAAQMEKTPHPKGDRRKPFIVRDVNVVENHGKVIVSWPSSRRTRSGKHLQEVVKELGLEVDGETADMLLHPGEPRWDTGWLWDGRTRRWYFAPIRMTLESAPWFNRILALDGIPPRSEWPIVQSWEGEEDEVREEFVLDATMWYSEAAATNPDFLYSICSVPLRLGHDASGLGKDPGQTVTQGFCGKLAFEASNYGGGTYRVTVRAIKLEELPPGGWAPVRLGQ